MTPAEHLVDATLRASIPKALATISPSTDPPAIGERVAVHRGDRAFLGTVAEVVCIRDTPIWGLAITGRKGVVRTFLVSTFRHVADLGWIASAS